MGIPEICIWNLKRQARSLYKQVADWEDSLDCGATLAREMRPARIVEAAQAFNDIMDQLERVDPTAPKARL